MATDLIRDQFEANFFGWHELTRRVIPVMRRQGSGRIVFCSSVLGFLGAKFRGAYVASKFAVEGMADTLRLELAGSGVHVVLIEPGPIDSRFREHALDQIDRTIDVDGSFHREAYKRALARRAGGASSSRHRPPPEAAGGGCRGADQGGGKQAAGSPVPGHNARPGRLVSPSPPADAADGPRAQRAGIRSGFGIRLSGFGIGTVASRTPNLENRT